MAEWYYWLLLILVIIGVIIGALYHILAFLHEADWFVQRWIKKPPNEPKKEPPEVDSEEPKKPPRLPQDEIPEPSRLQPQEPPKPATVEVPLQTIRSVKDFVGRKKEIREVHEKLKKQGFVIIEGIAGIGKTYIGSKIAKELRPEPFWFELVEIGGFDALVQHLASHLKKRGFPHLFNYLESRGTKQEDIINYILQSLKNSGLYLFFDDLHKVEDRDRRELFQRLYTHSKGANIVLLTRKFPNWLIPEAFRKELGVEVKKFEFEDAVKLLKRFSDVKKADYKKIWRDTKGHPLAMIQYVSFLKKGRRNALEAVTNKGRVPELFEQQYLALGKEARHILHLISVFNEDVPREALYQIVEDEEKVDASLGELNDWNLVEPAVDKLVVHDLFRDFTYNKRIGNEENHTTVFGYYSGLEKNPENILRAYYHIEKTKKKEEGIDYLLERKQIFRYQGYWREFADALEEAVDYLEKGDDKEKLSFVYGNLGYILWGLGDYDRALDHYQKALKIFEEFGDKAKTATLYNNIGMIYRARGDYDRALDHYQKALKIFEELGDKAKTATLYNNIGMIYRARGDYDRALEHLQQALRIDKELGDRSGMATDLNNIGGIYDSRGDYEKALEHYQKALKIVEGLGDKAKIAGSLNNIGGIYLDRGDYDRALEHYQQALKILEELGDRSVMAAPLNNIGTIYRTRGDYKKALEHYQQALRIDKELGDRSGMATRLNNIGMIYLVREDYEKALDYYQQALKIFEELGALTDAAVDLHNIGAVYYKKQDFKKALEYFERAHAIFKKAGHAHEKDVEEWIEDTKREMNKNR
ncbi:MAG: ATP-binding protein [Thermoplasmata archaeon]|nr:ATP-binding protein [Thermoplasmata archaeon]